MNSGKDDLERLEKLLASAWEEVPPPAISESWQAGVMTDIRRLQGEPAEPEKNGYSGRLVWRFSAAVLVCALLLAFYTLLRGFIPYEDLALIYLEDPIGFMFNPPFV
ncbi:MAG: hypothetical protein JXB45_10990 [Candidatus Krumholzibacteriota bacterium]|nr:hypothetical protein [Candidatus Krumholzibacteriota bacterium]